MSSSKSHITCHVLDASIGRPAEGVEIRLQSFSIQDDLEVFSPLATGVTNADGRCLDLLQSTDAIDKSSNLAAGTYKIIFRTKEYFERTDRQTFYPWVEIIFDLSKPSEHYHIPLLISPHHYTTYRGS